MKAYYYKDINSGKNVFHLPRVFYLYQCRGKPKIILEPTQLEGLASYFNVNKIDLKKNILEVYHISDKEVKMIIDKCFSQNFYLAKYHIRLIFNQLKMKLINDRNNYKPKDYNLEDDLDGYDM